jgi:hypothetical protein
MCINVILNDLRKFHTSSLEKSTTAHIASHVSQDFEHASANRVT